MVGGSLRVSPSGLRMIPVLPGGSFGSEVFNEKIMIQPGGRPSMVSTGTIYDSGTFQNVPGAGPSGHRTGQGAADARVEARCVSVVTRAARSADGPAERWSLTNRERPGSRCAPASSG